MSSLINVQISPSKIMDSITYGTIEFDDVKLKSVDCGPVYIVIKYRGIMHSIEAIVSKLGDIIDRKPTIRSCGDSNAVLFNGYVIAGWPHYKLITPDNIQYLYRLDKTSGAWELASGSVKLQAACLGLKEGRYKMMTQEESGCASRPSSVSAVGRQDQMRSSGTILSELRIQKGLSCRELSAKTGINPNTIMSYDKGNNQIDNASCKTVYAIASALGCRIEDLLDEPYLELDDSWMA